MQFLKILFILLFISCSDSENKQPEKKPSETASLKVMSYNIHIANPPSMEEGFVDIEAIADVINKESPDLVALQEVDRFTERSGKDLDQAKEIAGQTGMNFYFIKALNRSGGDYGIAILSKFPILKSDKRSLPGAPGTESELRAVGMVEVQLETGEKIIFAVTHLDHLTDASRRMQAIEMISFLKDYEDTPLILGGDLNMSPSNEVWNTLNTAFKRGCKVCPGTFPANNTNTTIDYLLLNNRADSFFEIKDYSSVQENYASDHLPIVMELEYKIK